MIDSINAGWANGGWISNLECAIEYEYGVHCFLSSHHPISLFERTVVQASPYSLSPSLYTIILVQLRAPDLSNLLIPIPPSFRLLSSSTSAISTAPAPSPDSTFGLSVTQSPAILSTSSTSITTTNQPSVTAVNPPANTTCNARPPGKYVDVNPDDPYNHAIDFCEKHIPPDWARSADPPPTPPRRRRRRTRKIRRKIRKRRRKIRSKRRRERRRESKVPCTWRRPRCGSARLNKAAPGGICWRGCTGEGEQKTKISIPFSYIFWSFFFLGRFIFLLQDTRAHNLLKRHY